LYLREFQGRNLLAQGLPPANRVEGKSLFPLAGSPFREQRMAMIRVTVLSDDGPAAREVGRIEFCNLPVAGEQDFTCIPRGVLSLDEAQKIARDLGNQKVMGYAGKYYWKK
jgi:hypothetical protein